MREPTGIPPAQMPASQPPTPRTPAMPFEQKEPQTAQSTPAQTPEPSRRAAPQSNIVIIREHRALVEFARTLSTIFNPFTSATALFIIVSHAFSKTTVEFWLLSISGVLSFTVAPLCCVLYLYITGRVSDFDMSERAERRRVFGPFVVIYVIAAVGLSVAHAPVQLAAIAWGYWGTTLATMIVTRWWKISTHAFGITGSFAALLILFFPQPLPYAPIVPLVCWARVYLRNHTVAQVLGGAALSVISTLVFFRLFRLL